MAISRERGNILECFLKVFMTHELLNYEPDTTKNVLNLYNNPNIVVINITSKPRRWSICYRAGRRVNEQNNTLVSSETNRDF